MMIIIIREKIPRSRTEVSYEQQKKFEREKIVLIKVSSQKSSKREEEK